MKIILFSFLMIGSPLAMAGNNMNEKDKKDSHQIISSGQVVGEVKVSSEFTGTPIIEGTEITFSIKCSKGYKLNPKFKKTDMLYAYDYGANGNLSTFNSVKSELIIHYRTAIIQEGSPVINKEKTLTIDLSQACTK